jgi:NAD(P)-dependent dehydrogenase (short-subunit alcohol dehydrogenase family)
MEPGGIALVTGASRGIGRATAIELARRGFDTIATMRDPSAGAELLELGLPLRVEQLDVTALGGYVAPEGLRVLVNNAGLRLRYLPLEEAPLEEWREVFETNVFGLVDLTRRAVPALRASGGGVICNVTSGSMLMPLPFFATYRSSKWAVSAICETLRTELAPFGIRIVEILPGPIDTDLMRDSVMFRLPEAVDYEPYRPMAERNFPSSASVAMAVKPEVAAGHIVDAILDDDGPMRHGCDPQSMALLDGWRQVSDEQFMSESVARFLG